MLDGDDEAFDWQAARSSRSMGWLAPILGCLGVGAALAFLVKGGSGRPVEVGEKPVTTCRALLAVRECPVFSLAWSPDGRRLAVSGFGPTVRLWDRESGRLTSISGGTEQPRFPIGWSDDGRRLIVGGLDVPVEAWDVVASEQGGGRDVTRPDGRPAAVGLITEASRGGPIRVRGPIEARSAWLPDSEHAAISAAFATDGLSIVTAEVDRAARIWDARSGRLRHTLHADPRGISCVAFSPDSSKIASGGGGPARLWDANTGALLATLGGAMVGSAVLGFSPDGSRLAAASWDGTIRVWDVATGLERAKLSGHDGQVLSLAWSPDGRMLATGGYDSTVMLWDLTRPVEVARADGFGPT